MDEVIPFFDRYSRFFGTSRAGPAERLRFRYRLLFEGREELFTGKRVIDLGAHDGRWAFCALKAGASYVLGLEAREETIEAGRKNFEFYGVPASQYKFLTGDGFDILESLDETSAGDRFDVGLCLGFLYHTGRHFETIAHLSRLGCRLLLIETNVLVGEKRPIVLFRRESADKAHNAYSSVGVAGGAAVSALPTISSVQLLLDAFGYESHVAPLPELPEHDSVRGFAEGRRVLIVGRR